MSRQRAYIIGILLVFLFVILSSAKEVFVGNLTQHLDPFFLVFVCFVIMAVLFNTIQLTTNRAGYLKYFQTDLKDIVFLNLSTTASWLGFFYALKHVEPAIVSAINTAIGPVITVAFSRIFRPSARVLRAEVICSSLIFGIILCLVCSSLSGTSAIGHVDAGKQAVGIMASLIGGCAIVANTIFSKRLSEQGLPTTMVMSVRFFLLIILSFGIWVSDSHSVPVHGSDLASIVLVAVMGIIIPLFMLQKGIEKSEPITVSLIISIAPVFTFMFQGLDKRLAFSFYSFLGVLAVVFIVAISMVTRHRSLK